MVVSREYRSQSVRTVLYVVSLAVSGYEGSAELDGGGIQGVKGVGSKSRDCRVSTRALSQRSGLHEDI